MQRLLSAPAIQFKGTGWYITDYAHKSGMPANGGESKGADGNGGAAETKSEAKAETSKPAASDSKPSAPAAPANSSK